MTAFQVNTTNGAYGPIQEGFTFSVEDGYSVLTGVNNAGKSALLQLIFVRAYHDPQFGPDGVVYIPPHRGYVAPSTETRGIRFSEYNARVISLTNSQPLQYGVAQEPSVADLPILLLNHDNFRRQTVELDKYLVDLGFSEMVLRDAQNVFFENVAVVMHGTGLRNLFTILCALTDQRLKLVLVDEPENSLEPRLQKALRDLFEARAASVKIVAATQSHLFLNRGEHNISLNYIVERTQDRSTVTPLKARDELYDATFRLLGNNTEDLFFPGNYLIVEGSSDQVLADAILRLRGVALTKVKVLSASGISNIKNRITGVEMALVPLVVPDSPYSSRVVTVIDQPRRSERPQVDELSRHLGDRFHVLSSPSLEEYLPAELYLKANRDKERDLAELSAHQAAGRLKELRALKREISEAVAGVITSDDLASIHEFADAVDMAIRLATR